MNKRTIGKWSRKDAEKYSPQGWRPSKRAFAVVDRRSRLNLYGIVEIVWQDHEKTRVRFAGNLYDAKRDDILRFSDEENRLYAEQLER